MTSTAFTLLLLYIYSNFDFDAANLDSVSEPTVPKSLDKAMEQKNGHTAPPGISIRNGPVTETMDIDGEPVTTGKRKSRGSAAKAVNYNEIPSASEDEKPMVGQITTPTPTPQLHPLIFHTVQETKNICGQKDSCFGI